MNKQKRGGKGLFVMLSHSLIDSPAFQSLPAKAAALYVHIARRYNGHNNGDISFSTREGGLAVNVSKNTAGKLIDALIDRGFLIVTKESGFSFKQQKARRFALTQWPLHKGVAPSNEWRYWKPEKAKHGHAGDTGGHATDT